jgi:hypothetical protein
MVSVLASSVVHISEWVTCFMPTQQFTSYMMARSMRWWRGLLCTRSIRVVLTHCNYSPRKETSVTAGKLLSWRDTSHSFTNVYHTRGQDANHYKKYYWLPALSTWCYWNNRTLFVIFPSLQRTQTAFYWALFWRSSDFIWSLSFWIGRVQLRTKRWNFLGSAILYYQLETI